MKAQLSPFYDYMKTSEGVITPTLSSWIIDHAMLFIDKDSRVF